MRGRYLIALAITGSVGLAGLPAQAGNNSTYRVPQGNAGAVLCSYNQRDLLRVKAKESIYILEGNSGTLGCSDKKPLFQSRPDSCQVKVQLSNTGPTSFKNTLLILNIFSAIQVGNIVSAAITAGKISGSGTNTICNSLISSLSGPASTAVKVPKGSCKVVAKSGSFSNC